MAGTKLIVPTSIEVEYKYVLEQPIAKCYFSTCLTKWIVKSEVFKSYNGKSLFVSPIYKTKNGLLIQPHIDIDNVNFKNIDANRWASFVQLLKSKNLFAVFSGRKGLHIYGNNVVFMDYKKHKKQNIDNAKYIRDYIFEKIKINPDSFAEIVDGKYDYKVSTTKIPMPRIGFRIDSKSFIVPNIEKLDIETVIKISDYKNHYEIKDLITKTYAYDNIENCLRNNIVNIRNIIYD